MGLLHAGLRAFLLFLFLSFPFGALFWAVGGVHALFFAPLPGFCLFAVVAVYAEKILIRLHGGTPASAPLCRSLERALSDFVGRAPALRVIPEPSPNALVVRAVAGPGTILVTQGLITLLSENELRAVLRFCSVRCNEPELPVQSACAVFATGALRLAPAGWEGLLLTGRATGNALSARSLLGFMMVYPLARIFLRLGGPAGVFARHTDPDEPLTDALRKSALSVSGWGLGQQAGASSLYLLYPWSQRNVLSLR